MEENEDRQQAVEHLYSLEGIQAPISLIPGVLNRLRQAGTHFPPVPPMNELLIALRDSEWSVRVAAARALGRLGEQTPIEPLLIALQDEHEAVRAAALNALQSLGERVPLEPLLAALRDSDWHVREMAVLTLGALGQRVSEEALATALGDESEFVRQVAEMVLKQYAVEEMQAVRRDAPLPQRYAPTGWRALVGSLCMSNRNLSEQLRVRLTDLIDWKVEGIDMQGNLNTDDNEDPTLATNTSGLSGSLGEPDPVRPRRFWRVAAGGLVALVIVALVASWFVVSHRSQSTATAHVPSDIIFTYHGYPPKGGVVWLPGGKLLSFESKYGTVFVWNVATGQAVFSLSVPNTATVEWSPDRTHFVVDNTNGTAQIRDAITGRELLAFQHAPGSGPSFSVNGVGQGYSILWSPDSRYIAYDFYDNNATQVWDALTGRRLLTHASSNGSSWAPDSRRIAFIGAAGTVQVVDVVTKRMLSAFASHFDSVGGLTWSPDGQYIDLFANMQSGAGSAIQLWKVGTNHPLINYALENLGIVIGNLPLFADSTHFLIFHNSGAQSGLIVTIWDTTTWHSTDSTLLPSSEDVGGGVRIQLSPDGKFVALKVFDGRTQVSNVFTGYRILLYNDHPAIGGLQYRSIGWSPDDRYAAFTTSDGGVQVWDAVKGKLISTFSSGSTGINDVEWSPDGKLIATVGENGTVQVIKAV